MIRPTEFRRSTRSELGSGVLSGIFGLSVFLLLLMFASHVLLNLWLMSSVDAIAHDAATDVAASGTSGAALARAEANAIERARQALGDLGPEVELDFVHDADGDPAGSEVALRVVAPGINLLPPMVTAVADIGGLDRTIVVAREPVDP